MHRLIFIFIAILSHSLSAATLNVPSQYGTINGALAAAQPGDTIVLAPGYYNEAVTTVRSGTADNRIVIDGQSSADVTVRTFDIKHSYITVKRMTVQNTVQASKARVVYVNRGGHYTRLENLVVDAVYTKFIKGIEFDNGSTSPFSVDAPSNCIVINCIVTRINSQAMVHLAGDNNLIQNCHVKDGDTVDFLRIWGRNHVIRGNVFENNFAGEYSLDENGNRGYHPDCYQTFGDTGFGSQNILIEGNIFKDVYGQIAQMTDSMLPEIGNWIIRNNLFSNISHAHSCSVPNIKYYNNVFYKCNWLIGGHALGFGSRSYTAAKSRTGVAGTSSAHGAQAFNNVFVDCGDGRNTVGWYGFGTELQGVAADYNAVIKYGQPVRVSPSQRSIGDPTGWDAFRWWEENGLNGQDPLFFSIETGDTRFLPDSPLKDAGATLVDVPDDFVGTARPLGTAYDIGMYESGGETPVGSAPVVTITSPTNGASFVAGSTQNFTATATDTEDGNLGASVVWASSLQGSLGVGELSRSLSSVGSHTITATVVDSDGRAGGASITVTVTAPESNAPPTLTITEPANGFSARTADWITFAATATDAIDGDISDQIIWTSSLNGVFAEGASTETDELSVGAHTITASVTDSGGLTDSASISVLISQDDVIFGSLVPLAWDANAGGENVTAYRVYERVGADPYAYILLGQTSDLAIDVRVPGGTHYFVVTAVNAVGESPFSAALEVTNVAGSRRGRGPGKTKQLIP